MGWSEAGSSWARTGTDGYARTARGRLHEVTLSPFSIARYAVTNAQFAAFVEATGYRTEAEEFGWSFVFAGFLPDDFPATRGVAGAPWWRRVDGADWAHPEGPRSDIDEPGRPSRRARLVERRAASAPGPGTRLPTEAEWEYAARGGLVQQRFPWGDELEPGGEHRMNVWQGAFPAQNTAADGYVRHRAGRSVRAERLRPAPDDRQRVGVVRGLVRRRLLPRQPARRPPRPARPATRRVMRGGTYLCHASYCNRYRVDARSANTPDSSTGNLGFRVARSGGG